MKTTAYRFIIFCLCVFPWSGGSSSNAHAEPCSAAPARAQAALSEGTRHGIAMHGDLKYPVNFKHFDYVNPQAPKGGRLVMGASGTFDSLNPLIPKGEPAPGVREYVYESLLARANDEPFSLYGLLAESIEVPEDRSWALFTLREQARFSDGKPVTVDDVIFSVELLREKGIPTTHRSYYSKVERMERVGERGVKMYFRPDGDREIPLIIGLMPILPKHLTDRQEFEKTTLKPLIGSGPYTIAEVVPGTRITFKRNPDYWGRDLPVNCGFNNFDEIRYEFFRDQTAIFEAFKKGYIHVLTEDDAGQWSAEYDFPAVKAGKVAKAEFDSARPAGMHALVFNTRRAIFTDIRVRKALTFLFDFEWQNANLYRNLYQRTQSFFERSELSSAGRPADARERALLASFPNAVTPEIMEGTFHQPVSDGSGRDRNNRRKALRLLQAAGYTQVDGKLVNKATGQPFRFEMMAKTRNQERLFLLFARDLQSVGIEVSVRQVDDAQFQRRLDKFDFDMIDFTWGSSLSPGNEQNNRWSMAAADLNRSFNFPGVKEPAVDAMIAALLAAKSREDFVSAVRALDRVLLSGAYVLPLYYPPRQWVAHWNTLGHPKIDPIAGMQITAWWMKTDMDKNATANTGSHK